MALAERNYMSEEMAGCIDTCFEAVQVSEWCADECIGMGNQDMARCIRLCRDVADIASMHARFMSRNSEFHPDLADTCAVTCEACADECRRFDHAHCQTCAEVLDECATSCRNMAEA